MKTTLLAIAIAVLIATGFSFGTARWLAGRQHAQVATPLANLDLKRELNLTDTQAAEVAKLTAAYQQQLNEICAAHCAARADLAEELSRSVPDAGKAGEFCQRMCAAQSASERLTLEHILQVRSLLTPEQQQRHAALINQQLTGACPMRVHQP